MTDADSRETTAGARNDHQTLQTEDRVHREDRFVDLREGDYWIAENVVPGRYEVTRGRMYLLIDVVEVHGRPHSVELASHPSEEHISTRTYLVEDFLRQFRPAHDPDSVRRREIDEVKKQISMAQEALSRVGRASHEELLALDGDSKARDTEKGNQIAHRAPSDEPDSGSELMLAELGQGLSATNRYGELIKAESHRVLLINQYSADLTAANQRLIAFLGEQSQLAQAAAARSRKMVSRLEGGLLTIGLYTGDGVEIVALTDGLAAEREEPLHLYQRLLFLDEESLVNSGDGGMDFRDLERFGEALRAEPALCNRLIPSARGIVAVRFRRYDRDYDGDRAHAARMNDMNRRSFLLVRDGERWHAVFSDVQHISRLFPTRDEMNRPFIGADGASITLDSLRYPHAQDTYEALAQHYQRMLVLIAGLHDRRTGVLGEIAAESRGHINLMSPEAQKEVFRFVYDDEAVLDVDRESFREFLSRKQSALRSGSRVMLLAARVEADRSIIPGIWKGVPYSSDESPRYSSPAPWYVTIARRESGRLVGELPVEGETFSDEKGYYDRSFKAKVYLDRAVGNPTPMALVLDALDPGEIERFIFDRRERVNYLSVIPFLSAAKEILGADRVHEEPVCRALMDALHEGRIDVSVDSERVSAAIREVITTWRAGRRWAPVPLPGESEWDLFFIPALKQLWIKLLAEDKRVAAAQALADKKGRVPLRLAMKSNGNLFLYVAPLDSEIDARIGPHHWVTRMSLREGTSGLGVLRRSWVRLERNRADESVLHDWEDASEWIGMDAGHELGYADVGAVVDNLNAGYRLLQAGESLTDEEFSAECIALQEAVLAKSGSRVSEQRMTVAFAVHFEESRSGTKRWALALNMRKRDWLMRVARNDAQRQNVREYISTVYANPSYHLQLMDEEAGKPSAHLTMIELHQIVRTCRLESDGKMGSFCHSHSISKQAEAYQRLESLRESFRVLD